MFAFNDPQLKQIAEFLSNLSLLLIGSSFVTPLFAGNKLNIYFIVGGLFLAVDFFVFSMVILKGIKKYG